MSEEEEQEEARRRRARPEDAGDDDDEEEEEGGDAVRLRAEDLHAADREMDSMSGTAEGDDAAPSSGDGGWGGAAARTDLIVPLCLALALVVVLAVLVANPELSQPSSYADGVDAALRRRRAAAAGGGVADGGDGGGAGARWFHEHASLASQRGKTHEAEAFAQWSKARKAQQHLWRVRDMVIYKHGRHGHKATEGLRSVIEHRMRAHRGRREPAAERVRERREYNSRRRSESVATADVRPATEIEQPTPVVWYAPFWSGGGFSTEARSFVEGLLPHSAEFPLTIQQCGDAINDEFVARMSDDTRNMLKGLFHGEPNAASSIAVCHIQPYLWHGTSGVRADVKCPVGGVARYRVGRVMFETDRFPADWLPVLNGADELWVPTHFHKRTFAAHGVDESKLVVIPEGVDVRRYDPAAVYPYELPGYRAGDYKFLSVFKWEERKGWRTLLEAFVREFTAHDNVALYILTHALGWHHTGPGDDYRREAAGFITEMALPKGHPLPRIFFLPEDLAEDQMAGLYKAADAFVLPTHGEGWGLPQVEAMSMALPVITTFWSGPTEYLTEENGYPLRVDGLEPAGPYKGHMWATPSTDHLMELMRYVSLPANHAEARAKGKRARQDIMRHFCKTCVSDMVLARLREIVAHRLPPPDVPASAEAAREAAEERERDRESASDRGILGDIRRQEDPRQVERDAAGQVGARGVYS